MVNQDIPYQRTPQGLDGFASRLTQLITQTSLSQSEFARQVGVSAGFLSDVSRGLKKPGTDFFYGIRSAFGASVDWLLTGEGTMFGRSDIDIDLFRTIQLYIAVARSAVIDENPTAKALLIVSQSGGLQDAMADPALKAFIESIAPDSNLDLVAELYNSHLWNNDREFQRRDLLAAAKAHFETQKPHDKMASLVNTGGATVFNNFGGSQRNAVRDYHEK